MGKHITRLPSGEIIGHTLLGRVAVVVASGLLGVAIFVGIFAAVTYWLLLALPQSHAGAALNGIYRLYVLEAVAGFAWGTQFAFDTLIIIQRM